MLFALPFRFGKKPFPSSQFIHALLSGFFKSGSVLIKLTPQPFGSQPLFFETDLVLFSSFPLSLELASVNIELLQTLLERFSVLSKSGFVLFSCGFLSFKLVQI